MAERLKKDGTPDLRSSNGGHKTAGRKNKGKERKKQIEVFLSESEFKSEGWESNVCNQVENKMNKKIKDTLHIK